MVSKLAVECEQKKNAETSAQSFGWWGCPRLSAAFMWLGTYSTPKTQSVSRMCSCTPPPVLTRPFFLVDLGGIRWSFLLGRGSTGLVRSEQLVPGLRFSALLAGKHAEKELHSLRCLPCASAKAPITMLVSWCS